MNPLVTVIIPTYKGAKHINRAVDSVFSQTYSNIELIVVDDNGEGTDQQLATQEQLKKYNDDPRFYYIVEKSNTNGSCARNLGISASHGDYLCFLDDDDEFLPNKTEIQIKELMGLPPEYGMVYGAVDEILVNGKVHHCVNKEYDDFLFAFLHGDVVACSSTVMITRQAMNSVEKWDESFKRHQDWEFFARIASQYKVAYIKDVCVKKYRYDNNLPKDGKTTEIYREHFLAKMSEIIYSFDTKRQFLIYDHHYTEIGKVYLKNKDLKNAIRMANKTKKKFSTYFVYFSDGIKYLFNKVGRLRSEN